MIPVLPLNTELLVFAIAIAYTFTSMALQRLISNPKKTREIQYRLNTLSSELNSMVKNNAPQEDIKAKQSELMPLMSTSMKTQFTPMLVILPIFFIIYSLIFPHLFVSAVQVQFFIFKGSPAQVQFLTAVFVLGLAASFVVLAYDKMKAKKEREARANGSLQNSA